MVVLDSPSLTLEKILSSLSLTNSMHSENKILFSRVVPTAYNSLARTILSSPTIRMHYWWPNRCLVKWFFKCICTDFLFLFSKSRLLVGELATLTLPIDMPEGDLGDEGTLRISIGMTFLGYKVFASSSNFCMWDTESISDVYGWQECCKHQQGKGRLELTQTPWRFILLGWLPTGCWL